jgi:hypothetical protein
MYKKIPPPPEKFSPETWQQCYVGVVSLTAASTETVWPTKKLFYKYCPIPTDLKVERFNN